MLKYSKITVCSGLRWGFKFYGMYSTVLPHNLNKKNKKNQHFWSAKNEDCWGQQRQVGQNARFWAWKNHICFPTFRNQKRGFSQESRITAHKTLFGFLSQSDLNPFVRSNLIIVLSTLEKWRKERKY